VHVPILRWSVARRHRAPNQDLKFQRSASSPLPAEASRAAPHVRTQRHRHPRHLPTP
jgi:hypothetical protein